ncbi:MAG: DUF3108 domain-containing protein [Saprospiraceae bacterium]|nr:DUF3108 domain-containing protein [Pyrinomonadaceae bacterium]
MRTFPVSLFVFCLVLTAFAVNQFAQSNGSSAAAPPFVVGETLTYEGKINKIIRGIGVADLTFTVGKAPESENYLVKSSARSKGTLLKLFRFSFLQEIDSTIGIRDFHILKTVKHDVQKERVRNSEAVFDYGEKRVTYVETDPKEPMRPPRTIASKIDNRTHDLVSGIYSLRMLPLAVGKKFEIMISDSGLVYNIPVKVTAREKQKSILGNVWCHRVEIDIFGPGRLIEKEGSMIIWMTDDVRRLPVRSQVNAPIGRVEIKLKTAKNLR